ncbi:MAG TPA: methyltransferase domain-containing protein [Acidimicrobiales bacterium]
MASIRPAPEFDQLADLYDETRGGEARGDEFASLIAEHLPPPHADTVLEVGVGTGVVALGLAKRGYPVIGLDVSAPMLARARQRLGPTVVLADAMDLPLAAHSLTSAVSVWVVQSVPNPVRLFAQVARVLRPGGRYVVCTTQRPASDDAIGHIIDRMSRAVDERRTGKRPRGVSVEQVLEWSALAGFRGEVHPCERSFVSSPEGELDAIARKSWPALRELDDSAAAEATRPAIEALRALPPGDTERRGFVDLIVLEPAAAP